MANELELAKRRLQEATEAYAVAQEHHETLLKVSYMIGVYRLKDFGEMISSAAENRFKKREEMDQASRILEYLSK